MDVQTENMDPPPNESQPSGKIRKGFKLFGKRKPGNIFSIRNKGDGSIKSPVTKSKTLDGLSETPAADSEQEAEKEKGREASRGEAAQAEDETLGEDGVLAAAPARMSISSVSSAKSLSFLSLLRGGRKGVGDRRVQTVSQPVGRQRRGLKGLFGNVKLRSKDKDDKEEAPPSPLLMSSRANSVEIIKEDLTLTPKCQPRSLDSLETESREPVKSSTTHDSASTSPSETEFLQVTTANVSTTNEHVPPLPTPEPPLVPGDKSLSSLLADISSLLTFDSISGGGDIMADVEAEWGKASSVISPAVTDVTPSFSSLFSKSAISSPPISAAVSTAAIAKPSSVAVPASDITKPSAPLTSFTKSYTLTSHSAKLSSDSPQTSVTSTSIKVNLTPAPTAAKPPNYPVTLTSFSPLVMSAVSKTVQSTPSSTSTAITAPPDTPSTLVKDPSARPTLTSSASKLASLPVTHSPIIPATQPPVKLDPIIDFNQPKSTSYKSPQSLSTEESKAPESVSTTSAITAKSSVLAPVISSKTTTVSPSVTTPGTVPLALSTPAITPSPSPLSLNKTPLSLITVSDPDPSSNKTQPVPPSFSASLDKIPPMTKPITAPISFDKMPPAITLLTGATTHSVSAASPTPPAPAQITVSQSKDPPASTQMEVFQSKATPTPAQVPVPIAKDPVKMQATHAKDSHVPAPISVSASKTPAVPAQMPVSASVDPPTPVSIPVSVSKASPAPVSIPVSVSKASPAPVSIPVSVSKASPAPVSIPVSESKASPAPVSIPVSVSKASPAPVSIPVSVSKASPAPVSIPVSESKASPAPVSIPVSESKASPAPVSIPVSVSKASPAPVSIPVSESKASPAPVSIPVSVSKASPAPAHIQISQPKTSPAPTTAPFPATSPPSPSAPWPDEAQSSVKMRGQTIVDHRFPGPDGTGVHGNQALSFKTKELYNESQTSLQEPSKEKRPPQVKASGLSKIPVVGGGRVGKLPVRDGQNVNDEPRRDPPTPVQEERPHFSSHDAGSRDKISAVEANVPTSKHAQEESQQPQPPKVLTSSARDSKIPVKHGTQPHTASHVSQTKEPPRTKIPVSKVPVRRAGNKAAATGGSTQIKK
ncbi:uncharacterized protein PAE49_017604 [Odontesthes bonariensis]